MKKFPILVCISLLGCAYSATTILGTSAFQTLDSNTNIVSNDGSTIEFQHTQVGTGGDQGSGVELELSTTFDPAIISPLYFQFATELNGQVTDFFFGQSVSNISSGNADRSDQNAFSIGIDAAGEVFVRDSGQDVNFLDGGGANLVLPASAVPLFSVTLYTTDISTDSSGNYIFTYDTSVTWTEGGVEMTSELTGVQGNNNAQSNVSNYEFYAQGTNQRSGSTDPFVVSDLAVSDMPIPEPSGFLLLLIGSACVISRRKR